MTSNNHNHFSISKESLAGADTETISSWSFQTHLFTSEVLLLIAILKRDEQDDSNTDSCKTLVWLKQNQTQNPFNVVFAKAILNTKLKCHIRRSHLKIASKIILEPCKCQHKCKTLKPTTLKWNMFFLHVAYNYNHVFEHFCLNFIH